MNPTGEKEERPAIEPEVIERLKKSKEECEKKERAAGVEAGRKWAKRSAEYDQIAAVAAIGENTESGWHSNLWETIASAALRQQCPAHAYITEFWEQDVGAVLSPDEDLAREYFVGFIEGVEQVWQQV